MRSRAIILMLAACLVSAGGECLAQNRPALREMNEFMVRGAFTELDRNLARHRLTLEEIEKAHLNGRPTPVAEIVKTMAGYEKLKGRVAEPLEVRGDFHVRLTPNTTGEEAYTTCFLALTYNGLVLSGTGDELVLVRPETKAGLSPPRRRWDRTHIFPTRLYRLGYLASDPILRRYRDEIGTGDGDAVLIPRANVVIVTDTEAALADLGSLIDSETLAAMGMMGPDSPAGAGGPRPPSPGAIASRECVHFYLLAYARANRIPLFATMDAASSPKPYPEAAVWLSRRGSEVLLEEYRRIGELIPIAQDAYADGWVDPRPDRTLTAAAQRRREIRFGLVSPLPGADRARTTKKAARRKR